MPSSGILQNKSPRFDTWYAIGIFSLQQGALFYRNQTDILMKFSEDIKKNSHNQQSMTDSLF